MNIVINGTSESIDDNTTVFDFLSGKKMIADQIVIAINDDIIEREAYDSTILNDNDVLDVMSFVGGG